MDVSWMVYGWFIDVLLDVLWMFTSQPMDIQFHVLMYGSSMYLDDSCSVASPKRQSALLVKTPMPRQKGMDICHRSP